MRASHRPLGGSLHSRAPSRFPHGTRPSVHLVLALTDPTEATADEGDRVVADAEEGARRPQEAPAESVGRSLEDPASR